MSNKSHASGGGFDPVLKGQGNWSSPWLPWVLAFVVGSSPFWTPVKWRFDSLNVVN